MFFNRVLRLFLGILIAAGVSSLVSCRALMEYQPPADRAQEELLKTVQNTDAVTFDVLIIHVPHQEKALLDQLWEDVDEQVISVENRRNLAGNGFRAGVIGASIPEPLSKLMAIKGRGLRKTIEEEVSLKKEHAAPLTLSKIETLQPGNVSVISICDSPIDKIPVLSQDGEFLTGEIFNNAQPSLSVAVKPVSDGSVAFEITPFFTFGEASLVNQYKYGQLVRTVEQPTKTFENLRASFPLRPGQFLIVGPSSSKTSGLGRYFFTQGIGDFDQKIVVLRLLFTQHDKLFHQFPGFQEIYDEIPVTPEDKSVTNKTTAGQTAFDSLLPGETIQNVSVSSEFADSPEEDSDALAPPANPPADSLLDELGENEPPTKIEDKKESSKKSWNFKKIFTRNKKDNSADFQEFGEEN